MILLLFNFFKIIIPYYVTRRERETDKQTETERLRQMETQTKTGACVHGREMGEK